MSKSKPDWAKAFCGKCIHFQNDPAAIEKAFPGLIAMSSGFASVRADDGLCHRHELYLSCWDSCPCFSPRTAQAHANKNLSDPVSYEQFVTLLASTTFQHDAFARSVGARIGHPSGAKTAVLAALLCQSQTRTDSATGAHDWFVDLISSGVIFP